MLSVFEFAAEKAEIWSKTKEISSKKPENHNKIGTFDIKLCFFQGKFDLKVRKVQ